MIKPFILGTCLILAASTSFADWIRLGSWNIEHLGRMEDEATGPKAIAEYVHLSGLDILAMQEIYDNDGVGATKTNIQLNEAFEVLNQVAGHDWEYIMLPNKSSGDKSQLVAIAWNKDRVKKIGDELRISINRQGNEWDRHPHAIKFQAGTGMTDIVVIPVHMKANYNGDFSEQRGLEAQALIQALDSVKTEFDDEDIVIIGDFNCGTTDEPAIQALLAEGYRDLNSRDGATHITWGPLDRILVPGDEEFVFSRQYSLTASDSEAFDRFLSDHQIVLTPIRILDDDD